MLKTERDWGGLRRNEGHLVQDSTRGCVRSGVWYWVASRRVGKIYFEVYFFSNSLLRPFRMLWPMLDIFVMPY